VCNSLVVVVAVGYNRIAAFIVLKSELMLAKENMIFDY
jgi:hypothetical protein